jgi:hypothetical protein
MILKEINIKYKKRADSGTYKNVYDLETHPHLLIKTFDPIDENSVNDIREEERLSKKYPDLFANIKKINYDKGYMIQEKMNADSFRRDVDNLKKEILLSAPNFRPIDIVAYLFRHMRDNNPEAITVIRDILKNNKNKKFYNKLISYFDKLVDVTKITSYLDVHRENFGYDNNQQIKMFDA